MRIGIVGCGYTGLRLAHATLLAPTPATESGEEAAAAKPTTTAASCQEHCSPQVLAAMQSERRRVELQSYIAARRRHEGLPPLADGRLCSMRCDLDSDGAAADGAVAAHKAEWLAADRHLVYMVPPDRRGKEDRRLGVFLQALDTWRKELAAEDPSATDCGPASFVYVSTTGVYPPSGRCDETSPTAPSTERAERRVDAEQQVAAWGARWQVPVRILRVPGIYGPQRLPAAGGLVAADDTRPANRIHVEDLAGVILATIRTLGRTAGSGKAEGGALAAHRVYNVGDGDSATGRTAFNTTAAALAGTEPPKVVTFQEMYEAASPMLRSFMDSSRDVDVSRMRAELGFEPQFASAAAGIKASLDEERLLAEAGI